MFKFDLYRKLKRDDPIIHEEWDDLIETDVRHRVTIDVAKGSVDIRQFVD